MSVIGGGTTIQEPTIPVDENLTTAVVDTEYKYIIFKSSTSTQHYVYNITFNDILGTECDILVVGGGGGGGGDNGGGGGGGCVSYLQGALIPAGDYTISIGRGGVGSVWNGLNGYDSSFLDSNGKGIIAKGGGGGREGRNGDASNGGDGGSGGGAGAYQFSNPSGGSPILGTFDGTYSIQSINHYGNAGGSDDTGDFVGGAGGGAGGVGTNGSSPISQGGQGIMINIIGDYYWGGGGGGAVYNINKSSYGGLGGGGAGSLINSTGTSQAGTGGFNVGTYNEGANHTGGGGGGGGYGGYVGGDGGTGIVIIKYKYVKDGYSTHLPVSLANTNYLTISGQEITGNTIPISSGGTGAITAEQARTNLELSTVASSGDYNDLINTPPSSQWTTIGDDIYYNYNNGNGNVAIGYGENMILSAKLNVGGDIVCDEIGIGTTANHLNTLLDVRGDVSFGNGVSTIQSINLRTLNSVWNIQADNLGNNDSSRLVISKSWSTTTEYLSIDSGNGYMGIGKTPAYKLDVDGNINCTGLRVNGNIFTGSDWTTTGNDIYYNNGNVGIGTNNPHSKLYVNSKLVIGTDIDSYLTEQTTLIFGRGQRSNMLIDRHHYISTIFSTINSGNKIKFYIDDGSTINGTSHNNILTLTPNSLNVNGNVGIGTDNPNSKLHIYADNDVNNNLVKVLTLERHCDDITNTTNAEGGYISLVVSDDNANFSEAGMISWRADNADDQEDSGKLGFWVAKDDIVYERLTITKDGNVGIDKTSPSYKLDVNGDVNIPNASKYKINGNDLVLNDLPSSNGNYGIGTNEPKTILNIVQEGEPILRISGINPNNSAGIELMEGNNDGTYGSKLFYDGASNHFKINMIEAGNVVNALNINRNNGYVGIGTANPNHPLHINTGGGSFVGVLDSYHHTGGSWTEYSGTTWGVGGDNSVSLRCNEGLVAKRMYVMSDLRIKTDIADILDDEALIKFRKLQPKKYKYIDKLKYKDNEVYGFIAQEVGEILPNAVSYEKDYIPDIMLTAEVLKLDENKTKLTTNENHNLNQNDIIRCKTSKYQDLDNIKVLEVIDEKTIIIDYIFNEEEIKFKDADNVIIIYGRLIEDFNILNKETIWTLTTSALQEVDRQLQQEKNKIMEQENRISKLEEILARNGIV